MKTTLVRIVLLLVLVAAATPSFAQRRTERQRIDEMILINDVEVGLTRQDPSGVLNEIQIARERVGRSKRRREMNALGKFFWRAQIRWWQVVTPRIVFPREYDIPMGL